MLPVMYEDAINRVAFADLDMAHHLLALLVRLRAKLP